MGDEGAGAFAEIFARNQVKMLTYENLISCWCII